jgi:uncharacterized protein YndB with AHSA1/START domain
MMNDDAAQAVVIERIFDAPIGLIWQMWTEPEHFMAWYGPNGAKVPVAKMDLRVGGRRQVCMELDTPAGLMQMWFTGEYREIVQNERLVYTESMSDEDGNTVPPSDLGMPGEHPTTTQVTVELEDVGGGTRMLMTHSGIAEDSPGAAGWTAALDKLAAYVEAQS